MKAYLMHRDDYSSWIGLRVEGGRMDAEREREYWLRERGWSRWKPAYYELTEEQRGWLIVGNLNPYDALGWVLEELSAERLLTLREAYGPIIGSDIDAFDVAVRMVEDALNMGTDDFERFFPPLPADIDQRVLDLLLLWGREEAGEFYE